MGLNTEVMIKGSNFVCVDHGNDNAMLTQMQPFWQMFFPVP